MQRRALVSTSYASHYSLHSEGGKEHAKASEIIKVRGQEKTIKDQKNLRVKAEPSCLKYLPLWSASFTFLIVMRVLA